MKYIGESKIYIRYIPFETALYFVLYHRRFNRSKIEFGERKEGALLEKEKKKNTEFCDVVRILRGVCLKSEREIFRNRFIVSPSVNSFKYARIVLSTDSTDVRAVRRTFGGARQSLRVLYKFLRECAR